MARPVPVADVARRFARRLFALSQYGYSVEARRTVAFPFRNLPGLTGIQDRPFMPAPRALQFRFTQRQGWPPLAWVARCVNGEPIIEIVHGPRVETAPEFVCEAIWAGPFSAGDFDLTDLVFGSGIRLRGHRAVFVSAGSTVDRLVFSETAGGLYVSNSLPALAATINAGVAALYGHFYEDFRSIVGGIDDYRREVATSDPPIRLLYFRNLVYDGRTVAECDKPFADRSFGFFDDYRDFLEQSLMALGRNMADPARVHSYAPIGTLSTGYDSPTVAVLSRVIGNTEVLTFRRARGGADDDGAEIAARLDLKPIPLDRDEWRKIPGAEIPFIAANAYGEEVHYSAAEPHLAGRVLLTGYHGDKMWDTSTHDLSPAIKRGDPSGLALAEPRLSMGFLHCPLAFFGVRNIAHLYGISTSDEMSPWRVGGDYDRPICRRIVEQAGVPRTMFGNHKSAASVVLWDRTEGFLPPASMKQYIQWLNRRYAQWLRRGELPPAWGLRLRELKALAGRIAGRNTAKVEPSDYLFQHLFPWALEAARRTYSRAAAGAAA